MTRTEEIQAEYETALHLAGLEDELVALKASGEDDERLTAVKHQLREWRCVLRLARPAADGSHHGFHIVDGELVPRGVDGTVEPGPIEASTTVPGA